jgi:RNA polymerase sigma-70 factor (ECF subfamily)
VSGDRGLAAAFAALSETDREAICLVAWEGLSIEDAARAAGCSTATLHVRLSRARARLARALDTPATLETSWTI